MSDADGRLTLLRVPCGPGDENTVVPQLKRIQFPVHVRFGMKINKAQGQSFGGKFGLDLSDDCVAHGQLYVGESQATDLRNLTVCVFPQAVAATVPLCSRAVSPFTPLRV